MPVAVDLFAGNGIPQMLLFLMQGFNGVLGLLSLIHIYAVPFPETAPTLSGPAPEARLGHDRNSVQYS